MKSADVDQLRNDLRGELAPTGKAAEQITEASLAIPYVSDSILKNLGCLSSTPALYIILYRCI